jgi:hypothetical protein
MQKFKNWFSQHEDAFLNQLGGIYAGLSVASLILQLNGMTTASNLVMSWGIPLGLITFVVPVAIAWQKAKREEQLRLQHEAVLLQSATEQLKNSDLNWGKSR